MPSDRTPGTDGLSASFYQMFWIKLKVYYFKAIQESHDIKILYPSTREGIITLIPKKGRDRCFVSQWRPITLLNVDYKILAKAIANRLKKVLPDIISKDQTGFFQNRHISQNIRVMLDILEYTLLSKMPAIIVSIDFEKAFDRVSYNCLWKILRYFRFGEKVIKWIQLLFFNFTLQTINNGQTSDPLVPSRGLFQGNPISSYLFLLIAEILSCNLKANDKIEGIEIKYLRYLISQFAGDMDLFLKFKQKVWQEVMRTLDNFKKSTGMKVSYDKTTIYRIGSIANTNTKFYSAPKIKWTNEPINVTWYPGTR